MRRQLIAGALACFGSSLFGQTITNPANQPQGALNNVQNTLQNGIQNAQNTVDRNAPQTSGTTDLENGQNRSSLNTQGQVNGAPGISGNAGIQSNTNLQNNSSRQPGQLNSNLSTQFQGQPGLGAQQSGSSVGQDSFNTFQPNVNNGSQSSQRQFQQTQPGQSQTQGSNAETRQNTGAMQNPQRTESANSMPGENARQTSPSQNSGPVYVLRLDASGREFICVNGMPIYFDNVKSVSNQVNSGTQNQYRSGYGNYDMNNGQNTQDQSRRGDQPTNYQQNSGSTQRSFDDRTNSRTVDPANSRKTTNGPEVTSPTSDRLNLDKQNEPKQRQNDVETKSDLDPKLDAIKPSDSSDQRNEPKS